MATQTSEDGVDKAEWDEVRGCLKAGVDFKGMLGLVNKEWPEDCLRNVTRISESPMDKCREVPVIQDLSDTSGPVRGLGQRALRVSKMIEERKTKEGKIQVEQTWMTEVRSEGLDDDDEDKEDQTEMVYRTFLLSVDPEKGQEVMIDNFFTAIVKFLRRKDDELGDILVCVKGGSLVQVLHKSTEWYMRNVRQKMKLQLRIKGWSRRMK